MARQGADKLGAGVGVDGGGSPWDGVGAVSSVGVGVGTGVAAGLEPGDGLAVSDVDGEAAGVGVAVPLDDPGDGVGGEGAEAGPVAWLAEGESIGVASGLGDGGAVVGAGAALPGGAAVPPAAPVTRFVCCPENVLPSIRSPCTTRTRSPRSVPTRPARAALLKPASRWPLRSSVAGPSLAAHAP